MKRIITMAAAIGMGFNCNARLSKDFIARSGVFSRINIAKTVAVLLLLLFTVSFAQGATKTWNQTNGGAWTTASNWTPNGVPATGDDVFINSDQSAAITAVPQITLNSMVISGNCTLSGSANGRTITISTTFTVSQGKTLTTGNGNNTRMNFILSATATGTINGTMTMTNSNTYYFYNYGILIMAPTGLLNGGASFTIFSGATLKIGSNAGISQIGSNTGSIQMTGGRTFSDGANYEYNGIAAQVTGNGLTQNTPANLTINNSAGVTLSAATTISGLLTMTSGTLNMANTNLTVGSLTGSTNITNSSGGPGTRTIIIGSDNTSPAAYIGIISNGTATSVSVIKNGTGVLTFSGINTFSGGLTVNAGIFRIGGANVLATPPVTLGGGTFSTGATTGYTETVGILALTDNSTITLGTGSHTLTFTASNGVAWTGSKMLTITGWQGGWDGTSGNAGKIFVGNSNAGLTVSQLSQIQFLNGGIYYPATILSTGEVVPSKRLTTGNITGSPFCSGTSGISVPFTYAPASIFNGNFTAQLSDAGGSFASPVNLQLVASNQTGSQSINVTIPALTTTGMGYRIRVISDVPAINGTDNGVNITINHQSADPTSATATPSTLCNGQTSFLTLNGGDGGGASETIKWYTGSCGATYIGFGNNFSVSPSTTTTYYGRYEDGAPCNYNSACQSVTLTVNALPVVSFTGGNSICINSTTNLSPTTGGTWVSNNPAVATVDNTGLVKGLSPGTATFTFTDASTGCSNTTSAVTVNPTIFPNVSITASANPVCTGTQVTFTAIPTNGGTSPVYQWVVNSINIPGANSPTYTYTPANNDNIICLLTSNATCAAVAPGVSNPIIMSVGGPYSGAYSVGYTGSYFNSLTNAFALLSSCGITGPITLLLQSGYSSSSETFPLTINAIPGVSATNTVTIKPAATTTISGSVNDALIKVLCNYIIIDGSITTGGTSRDLTITNTNNTGPFVVLFGSTGTTPIKGCSLK
ncbi:MAG: Ig-like domain-containing protein, partial [Bacteroidota bacterium]|nr:Ig-like domain-containing protein [Bacteroidota bacterium]